MVRATLWRLAGLTGVAALLLCGLVTLGVWWIAEEEGERTAQRASRQVAAAALVPLATHDFSDPARLDRAALLADLAPFLDSGMAYRIKVWTVEGDQVRVVFSDEQRLESVRRPFDPQLARRLDAGEPVVLRVPDDDEHRFESARAEDLREVFIGFRDAAGNPARFEVYVPVDVNGTIRHAMLVLLPLALFGVFLLAAAMLPFAVALARRIDRDRRERLDALHYGLAAAELARRDLAHKLHDDVIPDLAGAGLLLDTAGAVPPPRARELVAEARERVRADVRELRTLLSVLTPPGPADAGATRAAFARLVAGLPGDGPRLTLDVDAELSVGPDAAVVLHRVVGELLRNALTHSGAEAITVTIRPAPDGSVLATVADDGRGFDPAAPSRQGHIGLLLVSRAVADADGRLTVHSRPGHGTRVEVALAGDAHRGRVGPRRGGPAPDPELVIRR